MALPRALLGLCLLLAAPSAAWTQALSSQEYKITLDLSGTPGLARAEDATGTALAAFVRQEWAALRRKVDLPDDRPFRARQREVTFYDTADCALSGRAGIVLRSRIRRDTPAPATAEITLKRRAATLAAATALHFHLRPDGALKKDAKLEEDIIPLPAGTPGAPARHAFSASASEALAAPPARLADLFPAFRRLPEDLATAGIDPGAALRPGRPIREYVFDQLHTELAGAETEFGFTFWYEGGSGALLTAELSFTVALAQATSATGPEAEALAGALLAALGPLRHSAPEAKTALGLPPCP
jgi:hypothetical protein